MALAFACRKAGINRGWMFCLKDRRIADKIENKAQSAKDCACFSRRPPVMA